MSSDATAGPAAPDEPSDLGEPEVLAVDLPDVDATRGLGRALGSVLGAGDVLLLDGPLGAGKTVLVTGLAEALGVRGRVTSPTFVLAREHRPRTAGSPRLVHVDAYRLRPEGGGRPVGDGVGAGVDVGAALDDLDLPVETSVVVVEWGEGLGPVLASSWVVVTLHRPGGDEGEGPRRAQVRTVGPAWPVSRAARLAAVVHGWTWPAG